MSPIDPNCIERAATFLSLTELLDGEAVPGGARRRRHRGPGQPNPAIKTKRSKAKGEES
jgi:hypothetical protein